MGVRMGKGKGSLEYWVAVVKPGRVLFEISGVPEDVAKEALRLATHKLPCKCKVVSRADLEGGVSNEDKVLIEIIEEKSENKKAEGRIVEILGRQKDTIVGIFQKSKNFGFVVPDNKNFGTDIFISKKDCGKARNNHKVLVKITKYPKKGKNAEGKIIEILGGVNEAGVDMLSLIKEYDLPYVFPKAVVNEAKSKGNKINEKDIKLLIV